MKTGTIAAMTAAMLAGPATAQPAGIVAKVPTNAYLGRWTAKGGAELIVAADGGAFSGRYHVILKAKGKERHFQGLAKMDTIVFVRDGREETIRQIPGKAPCLGISAGERYCRG